MFTCPTCETKFKVTIEPVDHTGTVYTADSPITPAAMSAVLEFMRLMGPGRYANTILKEGYERKQRLVHPEWPVLTFQALAIALKRNGAKKWRTSSARGWEIPAVEAGQRPAPVARSVREEIDAQDYRETLQRHSGGTSAFDPQTGQVKEVSLDDLPFEIDRS